MSTTAGTQTHNGDFVFYFLLIFRLLFMRVCNGLRTNCVTISYLNTCISRAGMCCCIYSVVLVSNIFYFTLFQIWSQNPSTTCPGDDISFQKWKVRIFSVHQKIWISHLSVISLSFSKFKGQTQSHFEGHLHTFSQPGILCVHIQRTSSLSAKDTWKEFTVALLSGCLCWRMVSVWG